MAADLALHVTWEVFIVGVAVLMSFNVMAFMVASQLLSQKMDFMLIIGIFLLWYGSVHDINRSFVIATNVNVDRFAMYDFKISYN